MSEVIFKVDYECEMLSITKSGKTLFYGNFWDFNRPDDLVNLLDQVGIRTKVVEQDYDEWDG